MNLSAATILSLMLLAEAMISRYLTGSALHLALVLCAAAVFAAVRLVGPATARVSGFGCAAAVAIGGWHVFERGLVPISYAELPRLFHVTLGIHFFLWTLILGGRQRRRSKSAQNPGLDAPWLAAGLIAGAIVAWTVGTTEIYTAPEFLVRALGFTVLAGSLLLCFRSKHSAGTHAATLSSTRKGSRWQTIAAGLGLVLTSILVATWSVSPAQRAAGKLYTWFGISDDSTLLEDFDSDRPRIQSGAGNQEGAGRELPRKADIELDDSLRFFLEVDDAATLQKLTRSPVYARTSTLSVFADDGRLVPLRNGEWRYDADDGAEDGRVNLTGALPDSKWSVTYSVLLERRDSQAVPMVARTQSVNLSSIYAFADDWYQLALDEHQERVRFRATSAQRTVRELIQSGQRLNSETAPDDYLRLPSTPLAEKVRSTADSLTVDGEKDLEILLPRIREWLGARCTYSLRYDNPDDLTPVENFLYGERKGHCELFAAGTVMLLRSLGIPSRVAYGFCGGAVDSSKRILAFRESDFHSWAEVYLDGLGWVVFETTPSGDGSVHLPQDQTGGPVFANANLVGYDFLGDFEAIEITPLSGFSRLIRDVTEFAADWFVAICTGVIAIGALILWLRRRRLGGRRSQDSAAVFWPGKNVTKRQRPPDFLTDYLKTCSSLGFNKRPGQTWMEFLRSMKIGGICNGEFDELTRYVYAIRYADRERDSNLERQFRDLVKGFSETQRMSSDGDSQP